MKHGRKKGLAKDYHSLKAVGPGGIGCPCCNPWGSSPRKSKKLMHRLARRKAKQQLHEAY